MSTPQAKLQNPVVNKIMSDLCGAWRTQALLAAEQLDLFSCVARGRTTCAEVAEATGCSLRGIRSLLDILVGMGYLCKDSGHYALKPEIAHLLPLIRSPFVSGLRNTIKDSWGTWAYLSEAVRTGKPAPFSASEDRDVFPDLAAALFYGHYAMGRNLARLLQSGGDAPIRHIMDLGAGSGAWSIPFAQLLAEAHVTAVDLPSVIPVTRRFAKMMGVSPRYDFIGADVTSMCLESESYDLIIVGQLLHCIAPRSAVELLRKAFGALREKGRLVIAESALSEHVTDIKPILFGLHLLLHTPQGEVFATEEYEGWLRNAGFTNIGILPGSSSPLIVAHK